MVNRVENDRRATLKDVTSTLADSPTTASLVDKIVTNNLFSAKTAVLRGLEAGSGITLTVQDADNNRFNTDQKKIVISSTGAGGGETNTASNVGSGLGVFKQKTGVDLEFKTLSANSNKLSISGTPDEILLDVVPANINLSDLNNDAGFVSGINFLNEIGDVDVGTPGAPEDGYAVAWNNTSGNFELVDIAAAVSTFRGALVGKSADQNLAAATTNIVLTWDTEEYDTDSIHDNVTNNSRLTVPAGISYAKIKVSIQWQSGAANLRSLRFRKNGSTAFFGNTELSRVDETGSHNTSLYAETPPLLVSPGDYFEVEVDNNDPSALLVIAGNTTWFALEVVV